MAGGVGGGTLSDQNIEAVVESQVSVPVPESNLPLRLCPFGKPPTENLSKPELYSQSAEREVGDTGLLL